MNNQPKGCTAMCRKESNGEEVHVHKVHSNHGRYQLYWTIIHDNGFLRLDSKYYFKDAKEVKQYTSQPKDEWL